MVQLPSPQSEHNQQMPDAIPKLETDYNGLTKNLKEANELLLNSNNKQSTQSPMKNVLSAKSTTNTSNTNNNTIKNNTGISPQQLFELVSQNYENWQQAMVKRFENDENDDDNFSPFPNHDNHIKANLNLMLNQKPTNEKNSNPIFNYNLLEALDEVSNDMTEQLRESTSATLKGQSNNVDTANGTTDRDGVKGDVKSKRKLFDTTTNTLLNEKEIDFLRHKITQIIQHSEQTKMTQGFSLYDTKDEEGLHAGNSDMCSCCGDCNEYEFEYEGNEYDYDQGDYDLEEITRDNDDDGKGYSRGFSYTIPPTHHIEVELNAVPECDIHGSEGYCDCPIFDARIERGNGSINSRANGKKGIRGRDYGEDESDGPSCEFMFEYDHTGKLIPTYNNVAEKLREMELNGDKFLERAHEQTNSKKRGKKSKHKNKKSLALKKDKGNKSKPLKEEDVLSSKDDNDEEVSTITPISKSNDLEIIREIEIPHDSSRNQPTTIPIDYFGLIPSISNECCLICQYQAIYGTEPRQMKKWYDQRVHAEEKRRRDFKKKLQNAKLKVLKRQKDWRQKEPEQQQKQKQQQNVNNGKDSDSRTQPNTETLANRIDEVD